MRLRSWVMAAGLLAAALPAWACPSPLTGKDAAGSTQNFGVTLDSGLNCYGNIAIVDGSNAGNKATVTAGNALKVDGSAVTQPISGSVSISGTPAVSQSGTWTVQQGSPPWTVNPGTAANWGIGATGAAVPANAILSAMAQGGNTTALTGSSGNLNVNLAASAATVTVSGTVTANQGGAPWSQNVTQFGGTNISTGTGASGAGIPRVTVANDSNILATQSGTWTVQQGGSPWGQNLTQVNSVALGSPSAYGSSPGAVNVMGVNAFITNTVTVSGTVTSNQGGAPWSQNLTQLNGVALGSPSNYGSSPGAVAVAGVNAFITNTPSVAQSGAWSVAQSGSWNVGQTGTWTVQQGTPPWNVVNYDTGGRQLGGTLAGAVNVPFLTTLAPTTLSPSPLLPATGIWDGKSYAAFAVPGAPAAGQQPALVVGLSPNSPLPGGTNAIGSVTCSNCSGSGASAVDEAAFSGGVSVFAPAGGFFQTTSTNNALTTGQQGMWQMTANRAGFVNLRNAAGTEIGTTANPVNDNVAQFGGTNVVTGTGAGGAGIPRVTVSNDSNVLATQSGNWTSRIVGNAGGIMDAAGQNQSSPANELLTACQFNTSPTTITSGNVSPVQCNNAGSVNVNLQANSFGTLTVSGTVTANQGGAPWSENITQFGGVNISTGTGASGTGIPRVTVSNDSNILATQSGTWTVQQGGAPWSANITQFAGVALSTGTGNSGTGIPRVTVSNDSGFVTRNSAGIEVGSQLNSVYSPPLQVAIAAQIQTNTLLKPTDAYGNLRTATFLTDGNDYAAITPALKPPRVTDSALVVSPSPIPSLQCPFVSAVSQTASTTNITGQAGKFLHVCSYKLISASAQNVGLIEGTGSTCGSGSTNLDGQGSSGSIALAANGGYQTGTGAQQVVIPMQVKGDNLCVVQSASGNVSGYINYGIFN